MENQLLTIKTQILIKKSPATVYEPNADADKMNNYFIAECSRMQASKILEWKLPELPNTVTVRIGGFNGQ